MGITTNLGAIGIVAIIIAIVATVLAFIFNRPGKAPGADGCLRQIPARHLQL